MEPMARVSESEPATSDSAVKASSRQTISVALLGVPYVGKTTLFNRLAGFSQHTRNWPGTTVEIRTGVSRRADRAYEIAVLPSIYSLTANSQDEQAAREYLLQETPDVVVLVLSAVKPERSLYLLSDLLELPLRLVLAVNMMDDASKSGVQIHETQLSSATGAPVVQTVASRGRGTAELLDAIDVLADVSPCPQPSAVSLNPPIEALVSRLDEVMGDGDMSPYPRRWAAVKLLEGDDVLLQIARKRLRAEQVEEVERLRFQNEDFPAAIASNRYEWVDRTVRASFSEPSIGASSITEKLDRYAIHPRIGPMILAGLLAFLFWLVYQVADPAVDLLNRAIGAGSHQLRESLAGYPSWVADLLANGVLGGGGTVLSLFPILVVFFLGLSLLQQVGYMARAAVVADRFMHAMGLHGLSLVPMFLGFGCNVTAVLGARVVDSERARLMTVLLAPLIPCSGRMVLLVFVAGALFGGAAPFVIWGLVALNLILLSLVGVLFDRVLFRAQRPELIMELPSYHLPDWRTAIVETWQSVREFLVRAGTIILVVSVVIWALAAEPTGRMQESYLAQAGRLMEPLGSLMGLDWRMMVALLVSFLARKENALAVMGVLAAGSESGLAAALPHMLTPASALAYLVLQMTFIPCISTVAAIMQQTRSWRWTLFSLGYELVLSLAAGITTYRVAVLLGWGL
jgi:ferrous iron transport protein B